MKPNLFELARDAGLPVSWWQKAIDEGETREWRELEKFADLIVKEVVEECATICVQHAGWTPRMIAEQVTQHFGVK